VKQGVQFKLVQIHVARRTIAEAFDEIIVLCKFLELVDEVAEGYHLARFIAFCFSKSKSCMNARCVKTWPTVSLVTLGMSRMFSLARV